MKLSDKVYRINLGVPDKFEDMSHYSAYLGNGVVSLEKRIAELEAQLPESMQDCTIVFKECHFGHGRLTAKNWIDHGCSTCKINQLKAKLLESDKRIAELEAENERLKKWEEWAKSNIKYTLGIKNGMERAAEIVLERYPASQSVVGKELYQAIRAELEKTK